MKILLFVALFCGTAMADGDMGPGGLCGDMGPGGRIALAEEKTSTTKTSDKIVAVFAKYIYTILV
jgi:hypothetical protein